MNQRERLHLLFFRRRLCRLLSCSLSQKILSNSIQVSIWEGEDGCIKVIHPEITDDEIDALILNFRLIQQNNDLVSIGNISKIVEGNFDGDRKSAWNRTRNTLNRFLEEEFLPKDLKGIQQREFIDCIIYGVYAHTDVDKYRKYFEWSQRFSKDFLSTAFIASMHTYLEILGDFLPILEDI